MVLALELGRGGAGGWGLRGRVGLGGIVGRAPGLLV